MNNTLKGFVVPNLGECPILPKGRQAPVVVDLGDLRIAYDPLTEKCIRGDNVTPIESVEYQHWTIVTPNNNP